MSVLTDRLQTVFVAVGRMPMTEKAVLDRLQERWPTEHGYKAEFVRGALEQLREAGILVCTASGRWTKPVFRADSPVTKTPPPVVDLAPATKPAEAAAKPAEPAPATAEQSEPTREEATVAKKSECKKHPDAEFTAAGKCCECQRAYNAAYRAKQAGGGY